MQGGDVLVGRPTTFRPLVEFSIPCSAPTRTIIQDVITLLEERLMSIASQVNKSFDAGVQVTDLQELDSTMSIPGWKLPVLSRQQLMPKLSYIGQQIRELYPLIERSCGSSGYLTVQLPDGPYEGSYVHENSIIFPTMQQSWKGALLTGPYSDYYRGPTMFSELPSVASPTRPYEAFPVPEFQTSSSAYMQQAPVVYDADAVDPFWGEDEVLEYTDDYDALSEADEEELYQTPQPTMKTAFLYKDVVKMVAIQGVKRSQEEIQNITDKLNSFFKNKLYSELNGYERRYANTLLKELLKR